VPCFDGHKSCADAFGMNSTGCCALDDSDAVCCQVPLGVENLVRNFCCPSGNTCKAGVGCVDSAGSTHAKYSCGPVQGENCTASYLCSSGPEAWVAGSNGSVVVMGDSVSDGWTPVLAMNLAASHAVVHSPGALQDGGARSTSNLLQCSGYLLSTAMLGPLPLKPHDTLLINFGLHDYNMGLAGVAQYREELAQGLQLARATVGPDVTIAFVETTPAHNTADATRDDTTVLALNAAAKAVVASASPAIRFVETHAALIAECGPVPWADTGPDACALCAPDCSHLSVHYTPAGYERIAQLVWSGVRQFESATSPRRHDSPLRRPGAAPDGQSVARARGAPDLPLHIGAAEHR
jgi:lysophospholipase L1-like esterase